MSCFDGCSELPSGGKCDPCPEYFVGDGVKCTDNRTSCETMTCFGDCITNAWGGECAPCPRFFEGDGVTCKYTRNYFQTKSFSEIFHHLRKSLIYRYYILKAMLESTVIKWTVSEIV